MAEAAVKNLVHFFLADKLGQTLWQLSHRNVVNRILRHLAALKQEFVERAQRLHFSAHCPDRQPATLRQVVDPRPHIGGADARSGKLAVAVGGKRGKLFKILLIRQNGMNRIIQFIPHII